ncbi:MAG: thiamine pyrophosphokinase [Halocynthiibacter sp.]|jgi:thiamine pyrophosphokinase
MGDFEPNFTFENNVTLLGAGQSKAADLAECLTLAPHLIAADGGAGVALAAGHMPAAVIGDFDSIDRGALAAIPETRLFEISEQDSTDFEKCLRTVDAPLILGLGFLGARVDHMLAAFNAIVRCPRDVILIGEEDVAFHAQAGRRYAIDLAKGARVSLFPMGAVSGQGAGLRWPICGLEFAPDARIGTSNEATGPVELEFAQAGMIVILERAALGAAMEALTRA